MTPLTIDSFKKWMDAYSEASETGDLKAAAALFAQDAEYYETPYTSPIISRDAIYRYWSEAVKAQKDVRFSYEIMAVKGNLGMALWKGGFFNAKSSSQVLLDGVFLVEFDEQGHCSKLREWWHRQVIDTNPFST